MLMNFDGVESTVRFGQAGRGGIRSPFINGQAVLDHTA